jgi:hypothetical protein
MLKPSLPSFIPEYDPDASYADAKGMVARPDVDPVREMVSQIEALRSFRANMATARNAGETAESCSTCAPEGRQARGGSVVAGPQQRRHAQGDDTHDGRADGHPRVEAARDCASARRAPPISANTLGIRPRPRSCSTPSTTFTRSAAISSSQCAHWLSL